MGLAHTPHESIPNNPTTISFSAVICKLVYKNPEHVSECAFKDMLVDTEAVSATEKQSLMSGALLCTRWSIYG